MKKAIMYGAGNIGRGFIGQLLYESGYSVAFIDVNKDVISAINSAKEYPVVILRKDSEEEQTVKNVSCIDGSDINAVATAIAEADIMATAVGANILKFVAKPIAEGLNKRWADGNLTPLNIIICENLLGADKILKGLIKEHVSDEKKLDSLVGFVEASIGRMVPVQTDDMKKGNALRVCVESFGYLPLDKAAFKGEIPEIKNAILYSPFEVYIERKLYIHNMGHAVCAYLGNLFGYEYVWEAIENPIIELIVIRVMMASAIALSKRHSFDAAELYEHVTDLIGRFDNRKLGDTVKRVGNDLKRKLAPNDRMVGVYTMCREQGITTRYIEIGIAAALCFDHDGTTSEMSAEEILKSISGIEDTKFILEIYNKFKNEKDIEKVLKELK